jgi:hypothetical protein
MTTAQKWISVVAQLVIAVILAQTLFFKFSGAAESVYIFGKLGVDPWGRYLTAVLELVAVILVLTPATAAVGAALALGLMAGAVLSHLAVLGIEVQGDGGLLFGLACTVLAASLVVLWLRRHQLPLIGSRF